MKERHREYVVLCNAQQDSANPASVAAIVKRVNRESQVRGSGGGGVNKGAGKLLFGKPQTKLQNILQTL